MISFKAALERTFKTSVTPPDSDAGLPDEGGASEGGPSEGGPSDGDRQPIAHVPQEEQQADAPPPAPVAPRTPEPFSALELRDRVVIMLLFDQIVTEKQVAKVWSLWQQEYWGDIKTPLWRLLTLVPELDRELILAEAARVYGIEEGHIAHRAVIPAIKQLQKRVPASLWEKMVDLRLVPIAETEQKYKHRMQVVFASHDPTHPEVKNVIEQLGVGIYELRYAPEFEIVELLAEAFPEEYATLKKVIEDERQNFEKAAEVDPIRDASVLMFEEEEPEPAVAPEDAPLNTSSVISFFEEMLVEVVRGGASGVCLVPNTNEKSEAYVLVDEVLKPWRLIEHIPPELLFSTLESAIIRADLSLMEENKKQIIDRWIDGKRFRFRVSALPAGAMLDREAVVFRLLK